MTDDFENILAHLVDDSAMLRIPLLFELSMLTDKKMARVEEIWMTIPPARRRKILQQLVEIAEESFEVNFDPIFIFALQDTDTGAQTWAIKGLWENESAALIQPFIYLLKWGQHRDVRAAAATALGQYIYLGELEEMDVEVKELVEQALLDTVRAASEAVEVVRRAVESLAFSSREGIHRIIEAAYYHEDERMRVSAIFAMGRTYDAQAWGKIVLSELDSDSPAIRFEAARTCGELALKNAVDRLIRMINEEPDSEVQQNAIWSLGQIGGTRAQSMLEALASSENEAVRTTAEDALDELTLFSGEEDVLFEFMSPGDDDDLEALPDDETDEDYLQYKLN